MNKDYYIKNNIYNSYLNDELWNKQFKGEVLTEEENDYLKYCYHCEEARAGLL